MFIDNVLQYLKETETKIELPDWATKAIADKMAKDITGVQDNGDTIEITSNTDGKVVKYTVDKSGNVKQQ